MMTREEMMAKVANFSDGELENAIRSVELQRQLDEFAKKDKATRIAEAKTKLTDIDITVIGALKADSMSDLMFEVGKMQKALEEGVKESPEGSIVVKEFLVNAGVKFNSCNFTIDVKLNKDQITQLNDKIGRAFF
nr:MAG TPA: hypothetical protein [Caudoviricetes sp.]